MHRRLIFIVIVIYVFIAGCKDDPFDVDISDIDVDIEIKRLDHDLFAYDPEEVCNHVPDMATKYGDFFEVYNYSIIKLGGYNTKAYCTYLQDFVSDFMISEINEECSKVFEDIGDIEGLLNDAFRHYKYYYPEREVPEVISYISGFNQSVVTSGNYLGISLDKYLGSSCRFYPQLGIPKYMRYRMHRGMVVADCMTAVAQRDYEFMPDDTLAGAGNAADAPQDNLLNNMIYRGRIMYFVKAMLPDHPDSLIFGFTGKQLQWCGRNEKNMWMYLIEKKMLFTTEYMDIKRYIDEAPFTTTFTKESPGRSGVWIGWRIVCSYMKNNPDVTLQQLMEDTDYQKILQKSKYNP